LGTYAWAATYVWVAIGGALGSMARFGLGVAVAELVGVRFPWGTLLINVLGSFIIGWFDVLTGEFGTWSVPTDARVFVLVGICGGFTTFSSFSLQTMDLLQAGETVKAGSYILASVVLCLAGAFLGYWLATRFGLPRRPGF
jgi:fluoride exporter